MDQEHSNADIRGQEQSRVTISSISLTLTQVLVFVLCVATLVTLFARVHWIADLFANLRMQQLIGLSATLLLCLLHRRPKATAIVAVLIVFQIPWFVSVSPQTDTNNPAKHAALSITFANVLTKNKRHDEIIADLTSRNPDVIAVFELSSTLAAKLSTEISAAFPYALLRPQDRGNFGIGLFSKYPLREQEVFELNVPIESIAATVTTAGQDYRIFATHPLPPMGPSAFTDRNLHLDQLADRINTFRGQSPQTPIVLVGDLNLTPWSPLFADLEQSSGLVRACEGIDVTPTWYRYPGFPFGLVLDHGLISEQLHCLSHVVGPDIGSDHRSVTLTLAP
jgi:endonuclease/exonuclease/phosphatase (EEP) superfamily protein YafD